MERPGQEFVEFAKQAFQATMDAAAKVQQQTQKLMEELIRQGAMAQDEGKRLLKDWAEQSRKHMEEFQRAAAEGYQRWEGEVAKRLATITPAIKQEVAQLRQRLDELAKSMKAPKGRKPPKGRKAPKRR